MCRTDPSFISPIPSCRSSPTHSPLFTLLPLSYHVLCGSMYSFPGVRYSCPFSAGVLQDLLFLEVYSSCIHGERCTPCPLTLPPSWILGVFFFFFFFQLSCMKLYILEINLSLVASFANIFSHSVDCCFHFLYGFLCCANLL